MSDGLLSVWDSIRDRVKLHRQVDSRLIVLQEGKPDRRVLRRLIPVEHHIFPVGNRDNVIRTTERLVDDDLGPVVAVVDRDFDDVVASAVSRGIPVIAYDGADLESMLWETVAYEEVLLELGNEAKVRALGGPDALKKIIDGALLPLERLRAANAREGLGINFDQLDLRRRFRSGSLEMMIPGLCDALRRERLGISRSQLISYAETYPLSLCPVTGVPLIRGKDRLTTLGVALRRQIGSLPHTRADQESIAHVLYATARAEIIANSYWYRELKTMLSPEG